jgi:hypothetical protein
MPAAQPDAFDELIAQLRLHSRADSADALDRLKTSAWTSSSEMIGELGLAVLRLQSANPPLPAELEPIARRCMNEVRKVWPRLKLPN